MKLVNKTRWNTADLRAFIGRVAQDELPAAGRKRLHVTVQTTRLPRKTARGYAYYGTPEHPGRVTIMLPLPEDATSGLDYIYLATLVAHELAHSRGARHRQINKSAIYDPRYAADASREYYAWAMTLPIKPAAPQAPRKAIPKTVAINRKLEACRAKVKQYETKLKRTQTLLRKWNRKVRYYQRQAQAAAPVAQREEPDNAVPEL